MDKDHLKNIALVNAYTELCKSLSQEVKKCVAEKGVKQSYFEKKVKLKPVTFFRRMKAYIQWKPEELILLIKALDQVDKLKK